MPVHWLSLLQPKQSPLSRSQKPVWPEQTAPPSMQLDVHTELALQAPPPPQSEAVSQPHPPPMQCGPLALPAHSVSPLQGPHSPLSTSQNRLLWEQSVPPSTAQLGRQNWPLGSQALTPGQSAAV
jgi:hypothetical protein